jgi:hypothetical protein
MKDKPCAAAVHDLEKISGNGNHMQIILSKGCNTQSFTYYMVQIWQSHIYFQPSRDLSRLPSRSSPCSAGLAGDLGGS